MYCLISIILVFMYSMSMKNDQVLLLRSPKIVSDLKLSSTEVDESFKSPREIMSSIDSTKLNLDVNLRLDKKVKNLLKQDNKLKLKKKKVNTIDLDKQENTFKKKNKNKIIIKSKDSLVNISTISLKHNKYNKKKEKLKQSQIEKKKIEKLGLNNINKSIVINHPLSIEQLSFKLRIPAAEIITGLFLKGISVTVNQLVDVSIATKIAQQYDFVVNNKNEDPIDLQNQFETTTSSTIINRVPIITILGHVDHGKTSLLDTIRNTNLVTRERGGITQSIGAYEVSSLYNQVDTKLVFLDTPGHEAFSNMRLRCSQVADLIILIVAADDGLKPQTIEAIEYILSMKLPCIVAINKIDKSDINIMRVKEQLAKYNLVSEDWGGNISCIDISALKKINIDKLLTKVCSVVKSLNLQADPMQLAKGNILEAYLDKKKGIVANVIVRNGSLNIGDIIVSGNACGRVKRMKDSYGNTLVKAEPSSILEVLGFHSMPQAGLNFEVVQNEKQAKKIIGETNVVNHSNLLNLRLKSYNYREKIKSLNLIIKADTQGTIDAIIHAFMQIPQNKVQLNILTCNSGSISDTDIDLASNSQALIIAFNINVSSYILSKAEKVNVSLCQFDIIYDLLDYIQNYMLNLIDPEYSKILIGKAVVQTVFYIQKRAVAGCLVKSGKLKQDASINIYRNDQLIHESIIVSLKRVKDDVNEVIAGNECGLRCQDDYVWQSEDVIEAYELYEKPKNL
uniref:Translation initiation factor IF-2, chloroplastic n=1 Tax=Gracilariopsis mclachlanii TaxID=486813 RepID=A0A345UA54_9FLOR|nr:translation initiation factor 2 [Gracilariopsis mclachlanii]AXI97340.1 translation initiation factor 2 [Gracilariopsis mclachlanii]